MCSPALIIYIPKTMVEWRLRYGSKGLSTIPMLRMNQLRWKNGLSPDAYPDIDLPNDLPLRFIDDRLIEANVALDYAVVKLKRAIRIEQSLPFVQVKTTEDLMNKQIQINSYG